jgi:alkylation response protein AidB-like acyl-CoA dehydrogenase
MEMTISRDRWQEHLKTRGQHYHLQAQEMDALHAEKPEVGAAIAAMALRALAEVLERARMGRLTRNQHILLRLGVLISYAECAAALARRAARAADGRLSAKSDRRFDAPALAVVSRVFARNAATLVADEGLQWVRGADGVSDTDLASFEAAVGLAAIHHSQAGLLKDMDTIADVLYDRRS